MRTGVSMAALAGAAALAVSAGQASADSFSGDHYRMIGYSPGGAVALWVDTFRIQRSGGSVSAWFLMVGADRADSETGRATSMADYKLIHASFDCAASKFRFTEGAYYSYSGQRLRDYAADAEWRPSGEDSLAAAGARYLCRGAALQIDMTADNLNEALRFSRKIRSGAVTY